MEIPELKEPLCAEECSKSVWQICKISTKSDIPFESDYGGKYPAIFQSFQEIHP